MKNIKAFYTVNITKRTICLDHIIVDSNNREKGIGTKFMKILIKLANDTSCQIILLPIGFNDKTPDYINTDAKRLRMFYKGFGFKQNIKREIDKTYRGGWWIYRPKNY